MVEYGEPLSAREQEILCLVATGATNRMVAQSLNISHNTVKVHLRNIFTKLGISSRTEATVYAIQQGWVTLKDAITEEGEEPSQISSEIADLEQAESPEPEPALIPMVLPRSKRIYLIAAVLIVAIVTFVTWPRSHPLPAETCDNEFTAECTATGNGLEVGEPESMWVSAANIPQAEGRFGLVLVDDLIYLIGGETSDGVSGEVSAYDPKHDSWSSISDKPNPAANITAVALGGKIYIPGGSDADGNPLRVLDIYNPEDSSWTSGAQIPVHLTAYAAAGWQDKMYVFGGWNGTSYTDSAWVYDPESDRWESLPPMPTSRGFAAAAVTNNKILVIGGYDGRKEYATCERFDPEVKTWSACASMSAPRGGLGVTVVAGHVYAIGGGWESFVTFSERYNPNADAWYNVETPLLLVGGEWRNMGVVATGTRIYIMGGWQQSRYLNINQVYETLPNRLYLPAAISP